MGESRHTRGKRPSAPFRATGKLRIGDDWNAITIIALSQENPLKAVAEFVENAIDAGARNVTITRGRERGEHYLMVADDGAGVPKDAEGMPDFRYVATHICDSIKRRLKANGAQRVQGEFGIGLLSFWTVGEELAMSSAGADGRTYEMQMRKGDPSYSVSIRHALLQETGTRLKVRPLLPGVRQLSGEKIQWYLASELRERIRASGVNIRVIDRQARKEFGVVPRQFTGELLHHLPVPATPLGEAYLELYLSSPDPANAIGLYRSGTRILGALTELAAFQRPPWTSGYLQGIVDAPFLNLTPATRTGVIHDAALEALIAALEPVEARLVAFIEEQKRAEEERSSRDTLRTIQRAFREAMISLPNDEYD
ncbi:MAG: ATP-binding protein, partial [Burkholderiales bacterium]